MNFFDSYWEAAEAITSARGRDEFLAAIPKYYYTGVVPEFKNAQARVAFAAVRYSVEQAMRGRRNRRAAEGAASAAPVPPKEPAAGGRGEPSARPDFGRPSRRGDFRLVEPASPRVSAHAAACLRAVDAAFGTQTPPAALPPGALEALDETAKAYAPGEVGRMARWVRASREEGGLRPPTPAEVLEPDAYFSLMFEALAQGVIDDGCGRGEAVEL